MGDSEVPYGRVLLKLSGEALMGELDYGIEPGTIKRIANEIVRRQEGFLREGVQALKPMKMQDIADAVGVHISTISRATSGKYIQTPQGIFEIKRFFSGGTVTDSGKVVSQGKSVYGDTVNIAARLSQQAKANQSLVTSATIASIVAFESRSSVAVFPPKAGASLIECPIRNRCS